MTTRSTISIVIPAFNEARRIGTTLTTVLAHLEQSRRPFEIRVVDDGSADDTASLVQTAAASEPRIVLQREPHRGKGAAVRAGMLATRADMRFICDADLSMPITELDRFIAEIERGHEIVIGSREGVGARRVGEPAYRHLMGRVFNGLVRGLGLTRFPDTQCGFKMFTGLAADKVFQRAQVDGFAFDIEVLAIAEHLGFRVVALPIEWHHRDASRISAVRDTLKMTFDVLRIRLRL
jgi:dolichyl-phosphate beta-glucosyltransferase